MGPIRLAAALSPEFACERSFFTPPRLGRRPWRQEGWRDPWGRSWESYTHRGGTNWAWSRGPNGVARDADDVGLDLDAYRPVRYLLVLAEGYWLVLGAFVALAQFVRSGANSGTRRRLGASALGAGIAVLGCYLVLDRYWALQTEALDGLGSVARACAQEFDSPDRLLPSLGVPRALALQVVLGSAFVGLFLWIECWGLAGAALREQRTSTPLESPSRRFDPQTALGSAKAQGPRILELPSRRLDPQTG